MVVFSFWKVYCFSSLFCLKISLFCELFFWKISLFCVSDLFFLEKFRVCLLFLKSSLFFISFFCWKLFLFCDLFFWKFSYFVFFLSKMFVLSFVCVEKFRLFTSFFERFLFVLLFFGKFLSLSSLFFSFLKVHSVISVSPLRWSDSWLPCPSWRPRVATGRVLYWVRSALLKKNIFKIVIFFNSFETFLLSEVVNNFLHIMTIITTRSSPST